MRDTRVTDSIYIHDSVIIREGPDTMWMERWRICWRERIVHDTVREHKTDTIIKTETVEKVVEAPRKGSGTGWLVAAALFLVIVANTLAKTLFKR